MGLDGEALRVSLERRDYEKSVLAEEQDAERHAIRAIPAFVAGGRAILSGVQSLDQLNDLVAWQRQETFAKRPILPNSCVRLKF